ncbi:FAD dependent oxidoreductase [Amylocystis lapponica]|nr:FAD dependent oxidoreductase [Amylocystis lapponica]
MSEPATSATDIVILGAGVIGLTVAHVLSTSSHGPYNIKIVARDMPEDLDSQAFASPWAGANWSPIGSFNERTYKREAITFNKFWDMIPNGLIIELPSQVYYAENDNLDQLWYKDLVRNFRVLEPGEVPEGSKGGVAFTTISVNPETYLPWIKSELLAHGVQFVRQRVLSLSEAAALAGPGGVLVNATGLGARSLIGVEDTDVYPIRGQVIIVEAPAVKECLSAPLGVSSRPGEATYIIPRAPKEGRFEVLLGGTFQQDNWDISVDFPTARGIMERCTAIAPRLADKETRILRHNVGLRPARRGGARVETEWVDVPAKEAASAAGERVLVVHAYGFGPAGYQNSWGAAEEVLSLITANAK